MSVSDIRTKLTKLEKAVESGDSNADGLLTEIKIDLTKLPAFQPGTVVTKDRLSEIEIIRDVYEVAALYSVKKDDEASFERHVTQVKSLYVDYASVLPSSSRQNLLLGLNLVRLMAHNRIADFHTELELIGSESRSDAYVDYALSLEHCLMAGSFSKIKDARQEVPHTAFAAFVDRLMITVREEIAACCERAYDKLAVNVAAAMLSLKEDELQNFCDDHEWDIVGNYVMFGKDDVQKVQMGDVPSQELIRRSLEYAKELEQII